MRTLFRITLAITLAGLATAATPPSEVSEETFVYRKVADRELRAYVFYPKSGTDRESTSAILLFHGGGWSDGTPEWTFDAARRFASLGMVAISVEYRLSEGEITPIDALSDVCEAFCWARAKARDLGVDSSRVAGFGVSAGAHLIACAGTAGCVDTVGTDGCSRPDLLLLWSPALDVTGDGWFRKQLQGRADPRDYSPVEHVGKATPPTSIVHGGKDTLTPLSGAKRYCDLLEEAGVPCELNVYENLGHLLTRNLAYQEGDFDPDPQARADGIERHTRFLMKMGYIRETR
jgi:acetyl esterase/lipase